MAVKSDTKIKQKPTVREDLAEFTSLIAHTMRDLKTVGPPPVEIGEAVEAASLGKRHMPALLAVAAVEPVGVSELAKRLGLLLSSTSTIVGELSRAGLLERAEDDDDRRRTIVRLHEDYRDAMVAWLEVAVAPVRTTLERLSPQARGHFMEGWRILQEEARAAGSGEYPDDCEP
jgi:DNA-binding MarR family transcriptional regulator